jgi:hypothetical protein
VCVTIHPLALPSTSTSTSTNIVVHACLPTCFGCLPLLATCPQVALGHGIAQNELMHLSDLFSSLTKGLIAWPYLDIPFTNWHRC